MAGAIEKKINDVVSELKDAPNTHIDARAAILDAITLSREFSNTYLDALCRQYTSGSGSYSLHEICVALAKQRNLCFGGKAIETDSSSFDLPTHGAINGSLDLTEPSKTLFGIKATNLFETDTITLSNTPNANQTIDGNTFSTYIGDYYLVRSRVSGELEPTSGNLSAYTTPDGGDVVFGNAVAWVDGTGGNITTEQEANTWNYHWAKANVASVTTAYSGAWNELTTLTLSDVLTQGSNTDYSPVGPSFNNKYYLKRHADSVNTFTITGTTEVNSAAVTGISEADLAKVKHGDVISGTGIPDDNVTILAVQTEKSTIRLSESGIATAAGTITLTVNSVPVGHAAHDIFCQVQVVGEGLVKNDNWLPTGNTTLKDGNQYDDANEGADHLLVASTSQFIGLLGFFNPNNAESDDLIKGASGAYVSEGKEYNDINYPDIIRNPIFPANAGTTKTYERKPDDSTGEIIGTQPTGLGDPDVWCGRFVAWNKGRENAAGAVTEYRYKIDNAEKYFYAPPSHLGYNYGTTSVVADPHHPPTQLGSYSATEQEPRNICPRQGMNTIVSRVTGSSVTIGSTSVTTAHRTDIPADDSIYYGNPTSNLSGTGPTTAATGGVTGSADRSGFLGTYYQQAANGIMCAYQTKVTIDVTTVCSSSTYTATYTEHLIGPFQCYYNHVQKHMFEGTNSAMPANTDVGFIMDTVDRLQLLDSFRDPITTGVAAPRSASGGTAGDANGTGISDAAFDTYLASEPEGDHGLLQTGMTKFRANFAASGRSPAGEPTSGTYPRQRGTGNPVDFESFTQDSTAYNCVTLWTNFTAELVTFKDNCDKRVSAIPSSPAPGEVLPYGRAIFNGVNHLLGRDVDLMGGIIKDVESLTDLINLVKKARNKYDIFNGRDKVYPV